MIVRIPAGLFNDSVWEPYATPGNHEKVWLVVGALYHLGRATLEQVAARVNLGKYDTNNTLISISRRLKSHEKRRPQLVKKQLWQPGAAHNHIHSLTRVGMKIAKREWSAPKQLTELQYQALEWVRHGGQRPHLLIKWMCQRPPGAEKFGVKLPRPGDIRFVFRKLLAACFLEYDEKAKLLITFAGRVRMLAKEAADERREDRPRRKRSPKRKRKRRRRVR